MELLTQSPEVVIAFITAFFGTIGTIGVAAIRQRDATQDLKNVTVETLESAKKAASNTQKVSNGFADRVDRKLDFITEQQENLYAAFTEHLEWHLKQETK